MTRLDFTPVITIIELICLLVISFTGLAVAEESNISLEEEGQYKITIEKSSANEIILNLSSVAGNNNSENIAYITVEGKDLNILVNFDDEVSSSGVLSVNEKFNYIDDDIAWDDYYIGGEGSVSTISPKVGASSVQVNTIDRSVYNGVTKELFASPLNLSEYGLRMYVRSSDWNRIEAAELVLASDGYGFADFYVFDIKKHLSDPVNGHWIEVVMPLDSFEKYGSPDAENIDMALLRIKGDGNNDADMCIDGFGSVSPLPANLSAGRQASLFPGNLQSVACLAEAIENQGVERAGCVQTETQSQERGSGYSCYEEEVWIGNNYDHFENVTSEKSKIANVTCPEGNATVFVQTWPITNNTSAVHTIINKTPAAVPTTPMPRQNFSEIREKNGTDNMTEYQRHEAAVVPHKHHKEEGRIRVIKPSDKIEAQFHITSPSERIHDNNTTFSVASNLTASKEKRLFFRYEWKVSKEGSANFIRLTGNNKTVSLEDGKYAVVLTVTDYLGRTQILTRVFEVDAEFGTGNPAENKKVSSEDKNSGNIWQAGLGIDFNTSSFYLASISWLRGEGVDRDDWQAYKDGGKDLRKKYLMSLPGEKKIAFVMSLIKGNGGMELDTSLIYAG